MTSRFWREDFQNGRAEIFGANHLGTLTRGLKGDLGDVLACTKLPGRRAESLREGRRHARSGVVLPLSLKIVSCCHGPVRSLEAKPLPELSLDVSSGSKDELGDPVYCLVAALSSRSKWTRPVTEILVFSIQ